MIGFIKKTCVILIGFVFFILPATASANIEVLFQAPVTYYFFAADDGETLKANSNPSGFLGSMELTDFAGLGKNYSFGLGIDYYTIPLEDQINKITYSFANVHARFPFFSDLLSARAGIGFGSTEIEGISKDSFQKTEATQFFGKIGLDFSEEAELILSLHNVFAQIKKKNNSTLLEAGGILLSLGLGMKF